MEAKELKRGQLCVKVVPSLGLGVFHHVSVRIRVDLSIPVAVFHGQLLESATNGIPVS